MKEPIAPKDRVSVANALAGDGVVVAARLIAINAMYAESAAARGDLDEAFAKFRVVARALDEARDIVAIAGRIAN